MPKSMEERLEEGFAPGWRPAPGDMIVGTVVDISQGEGDYGPYPIVTIEQPNGEALAVHAFHTVLKKELSAKRPTEGDKLGIKYLGMPAGKNYEAYRVVLERVVRPDAQASAWAAMEQSADAELATAVASGTPVNGTAARGWASEEPF